MSEFFIGLMSGTSADGIDAALVEFTPAPRLHASRFLAYPPLLRERILQLASASQSSDALEAAGALDTELGREFARAALELLQQASLPAARVRAIGSHGQTVRHRPGGAHPFSMQIGDPNLIAAHTGISVVADFRRRDLALGGQGAPLVPAFHRAVFGDAGEHRAVVNIGGIANVTLLPAGSGEVTGFDTGPGNVLLDAWSARQFGAAHDEAGAQAAAGRVDAALLHVLLADEYFALAPPKSTGREHFNPDWLERHLRGRKLAPQDVMATLAELTAHSILDAILHHAVHTARVLVCGGGVHNRHLMQRLGSLFGEARVESTERHGIHPDWVEAMAFAWLARETLAGRPGNLPSVTGASRASVLGAIYPA
ncbi:MAG TPA: anhydro-N-acetylmuramic acid kinase [Gammaproteobacteria bacterium]|nr:anhydro-N-acetylmuramic acid kinase [Gammaproteobacteria bacterium]